MSWALILSGTGAIGRAAADRLLAAGWQVDVTGRDPARAFAAAPPESRTLVVTCQAADPGRRDRARAVADVIIAGRRRVDPGQAMTQLAGRGYRVVLCEGGPTWLGELVATGWLDELCLTIAPLMGGDPLPVSVSPPGAPLAQFTLRHVLQGGDTLFLRYERGPE
jgi:riboflavin biosynthesis pyrimidine reductase